MNRDGIRKGEPWGNAVECGADTIVVGGDSALARAVQGHVDLLVAWTPDATSDLAITLGLTAATSAKATRATSGLALPIDVLSATIDGGEPTWAVASVVVATAPAQTRRWHRRMQFSLDIDGRSRTVTATGIIAMNAQHLSSARVVPKGHPGDTKAEVQWFGLAPSERSKMRSRLALAEHLGHDDVGNASFRRLTIDLPGKSKICIDGLSVWAQREVQITVIPGAFRILV